MCLFDGCTIILWNSVARLRVFQEECIMGISSRMTLGLEKTIKVPEGALNKSIRWHFIETHLNKNLSELGAHLQ